MTDRQRAVILANARAHLERTVQGHVQYAKTKKGSEWKAALKLLDQLAADLEPKKPKTPWLGPVVPGGVTLLNQDLTHMTGGLDHYPALDAGWKAGLSVIAPEALTVTRQSSARRRDGNPNGKAFYADGISGLKYWFGHIDAAPAVGAKFRKGAKLAEISSNHEEPHLHIGIDARALIGKDLLYGRTGHGPDYTHGSPTIGKQLAEAST